MNVTNQEYWCINSLGPAAVTHMLLGNTLTSQVHAILRTFDKYLLSVRKAGLSLLYQSRASNNAVFIENTLLHKNLSHFLAIS